jgi:hypothetical protein
LLALCVPPAFSQWENLPAPAWPRTTQGELDSVATVPRAANGKPDLSGIWWVPDYSIEGIDAPPKYSVNLAADLDPASLGMLPWAEALVQERLGQQRKDFPMSKCLPPPPPAITAVPVPFKIIQSPELIVILHEFMGQFRQIFTDRRSVAKSPNPTWLGYSVGHWDGDTLVVESTGFNEGSWLDGMGHPHTDALRVTERFHRRDFGHMDIQFTIDDPKAYSKPWTNTLTVELVPEMELYEHVCNENEKDVQHLVGN